MGWELWRIPSEHCGNYMYHLLEGSQALPSSHAVYLFVSHAIIARSTINWLSVLMETQSVFTQRS
jgi:hypothetical protein